MTLVEAESAYATRLGEERRARQAVIDVLDGLARHLDFFAAGRQRDHVIATMRGPDDTARLRSLIDQWIENLSATKEALA